MIILTSNRSRSSISFIVLIVLCVHLERQTDSCSISEGHTHCHLPGSFYFCHPSQVEDWNQSVPIGEVSLPTPPDSISECASDYQEMSGHPWNQASLPEEWTTAPAPDNMSMQPTSNEWPGQGVPVTAHDIQTLDTAAFLSAPQSTVDFGLSPVLSHESQSSYTRNSFSEPDTCYLPPGLDLSFTSEPSWHSSGPVVYHSPDVTQQPTGYGFVPHDQSAPSVACALSAPQTLYPGSQPLEFFPQGGQVLYQRRTTSYPQPAPMRPLLPRTESPTASSDGTRGPQRTLKPHMQGSQSSQRTASSVSSTSGQSQDGSQHTLASTQSSGHVMLASQQVQTLPHRSSGPMQSGALVHPNMVLYNQHGASASSVSDPTDEDFSTYIRFDQEDQTTSPGALRSDDIVPYTDAYDTDCLGSYVSGHGVQPAVPSYMPGDVKPVLSRTEQDLNAVYQGSSSATSLSSDNDEGRHRTHPLYSEGPQSDGLYHCPFKAKDPNCPHKATKLKCNYEYGSPPSNHASHYLLTTLVVVASSLILT